jgi:hypothetical protein
MNDYKNKKAAAKSSPVAITLHHYDVKTSSVHSFRSFIVAL